MTKEEALAFDLALEALEDLQRQYSIYPNSFWDWSKGRGAITAIKQARSAPVQEPVGTYGEIYESMQALLRSGLQSDQQIYAAMKDKPLYTTPPAAPVQLVAFEVGLVEWVGNKLMATPKTTTTPPASWMEMVTANLVREGVNKHKARELAEHFYNLKENT